MKKIILSIFAAVISILNVSSQIKIISKDSLNKTDFRVNTESHLLQDIYGNKLYAESVKIYADTLLFAYHPKADGIERQLIKIPISQIATIDGKSEVYIKRHAIPDERSALNTLRTRQLTAFYIGAASAALMFISPEFAETILYYLLLEDTPGVKFAIVGAIPTFIHLSSYTGIRKMKKYHKATKVSNLIQN